MKKVLTITLIIIIALSLGGCSNNKLKILRSKYPINIAFTSDWDVQSYNGYECTDYSTVKNIDQYNHRQKQIILVYNLTLVTIEMFF